MVTTTGVPSAGGGESRTVTVHGAAAGFAQEITVGKHRLSGDEPISDGGTDTGPNPYDLLLAALGLYSVVHQSLAERRAEIGLRVALGATRRDIVGLVTRSVAPLLTAGVIAGTALGAVIARSAGALLPGIEATAPGGYLGAVALTVVVTSLAAANPVWRAATETPTQALRH